MAKNVINEACLTNQSMGASFESNPIKLALAKSFSIQLQFAGSTPTGTFKLMSSSDITNKASDVTNWNDVSDSSQAISADGSHKWDVKLQLKWVKVVYTRSSGSGVCSGVVFAVEEY